MNLHCIGKGGKSNSSSIALEKSENNSREDSKKEEEIDIELESLLQMSSSDLKSLMQQHVADTKQLEILPYVSKIYENLQYTGNLKNIDGTLHLVFQIAFAFRCTLDTRETLKEKSLQNQIVQIQEQLRALLQFLYEVSQDVDPEKFHNKVDNLRKRLNIVISSYQKLREDIKRKIIDLTAQSQIQKFSVQIANTSLAILCITSLRNGILKQISLNSIVPVLGAGLLVYLNTFSFGKNSENEESLHALRGARETFLEVEKTLGIALINIEITQVDDANFRVSERTHSRLRQKEGIKTQF